MAKFCSKCGAQLEDGAIFCANCGTRQGASAPAPAPVQQAGYRQPQNAAQAAVPAKKKSKKGAVIAIILFVIIACIGAGIAIPIIQNNTVSHVNGTVTVRYFTDRPGKYYGDVKGKTPIGSGYIINERIYASYPCKEIYRCQFDNDGVLYGEIDSFIRPHEYAEANTIYYTAEVVNGKPKGKGNILIGQDTLINAEFDGEDSITMNYMIWERDNDNIVLIPCNTLKFEIFTDYADLEKNNEYYYARYDKESKFIEGGKLCGNNISRNDSVIDANKMKSILDSNITIYGVGPMNDIKFNASNLSKKLEKLTK